MRKKDVTMISVKKTLQLDNNVHMRITELLNENNEVIGKRVSFDLPQDEIKEYLDKWAALRNAYKYRKR